ncbi:MAG: hypothetical protein FJZ90_14275 [Chloroflexi bacterium]|nr:hypothetical protein [Chloroflexota bacterium]
MRVEAVYNYVKKGKAAVDEPSFVESVGQVMREGSAVYKVAFDAPEVGAIPESLSDLMSGWVVIKVTPPPLPAGRTITVSGTLSKLDELGPLYKDVLQPLRSQNPDELTISLTVRAHYKTDPGAGLTASLADGLTKAKFPGLELRDDRKE